MVPWTHVLSILGDVYHIYIYIFSTLVGLCPRFCRVHSQWIGWSFTFFAFLDFVGNDFHSGVVGVEEGTRGHFVCVRVLFHPSTEKKRSKKTVYKKTVYIYCRMQNPDSRIPVESNDSVYFGMPGNSPKNVRFPVILGGFSRGSGSASRIPRGFTSQLFKRQISPQKSRLSHFPSGLLQRAKMSGIQEYKGKNFTNLQPRRLTMWFHKFRCQWIETKKFRGP